MNILSKILEEPISEATPRTFFGASAMAATMAFGGHALKDRNVEPKSDLPPASQSAEYANDETSTIHNEFGIPEEDMLALTIWGEARNQDTKGMLAVGFVILNRAQHSKWGKTISDVVTQRKQFSCWNSNDPNKGKMLLLYKISKLPEDNPDFNRLTKRLGKDWEQFLKAKKIARAILNGKVDDPTNGSLFYHTTAIKPSWSHKLYHVGDIGDHRFYTFNSGR